MLILYIFLVFVEMADRRAELEKKKKRLAQLREEKERRQREKQASLLEVTIVNLFSLILFYLLIFI